MLAHLLRPRLLLPRPLHPPPPLHLARPRPHLRLRRLLRPMCLRLLRPRFRLCPLRPPPPTLPPHPRRLHLASLSLACLLPPKGLNHLHPVCAIQRVRSQRTTWIQLVEVQRSLVAAKTHRLHHQPPRQRNHHHQLSFPATSFAWVQLGEVNGLGKTCPIWGTLTS